MRMTPSGESITTIPDAVRSVFAARPYCRRPLRPRLQWLRNQRVEGHTIQKFRLTCCTGTCATSAFRRPSSPAQTAMRSRCSRAPALEHRPLTMSSAFAIAQ